MEDLTAKVHENHFRKVGLVGLPRLRAVQARNQPAERGLVIAAR
jgi:hypothetical protein